MRLARRQQGKQPAGLARLDYSGVPRQVVTSGSEAAGFDDLDRPRHPLRVPNHSDYRSGNRPKMIPG
jgi:hypothetical protein